MTVNKVTLIGNLGRDPEVRHTKTTTICNLSVATTYKRDGDEQTEWHRVVVFGKTAEACARYLSTGRQVYIEGRLQTRSYDKDGQKHYSTEIVAGDVKFLGSKSDEPRGERRDGGRTTRGNAQSRGWDAPDDDQSEDGIPF